MSYAEEMKKVALEKQKELEIKFLAEMIPRVKQEISVACNAGQFSLRLDWQKLAEQETERGWLVLGLERMGFTVLLPITHDCGYNEDCNERCLNKHLEIRWGG